MLAATGVMLYIVGDMIRRHQQLDGELLPKIQIKEGATLESLQKYTKKYTENSKCYSLMCGLPYQLRLL